MRLCSRIAAIRRQVQQLAAIATACAAQSDGYRRDDRCRLLPEAETELILGDELVAALGGGRRRA